MLWMTWQLLHKLLPLSKNEKTMSSVQSVTQLISALPICVHIVQIYLHSYATLASTSPVSAWHVSHVTCHMSASINRSFFSYIKTIPSAPCLLPAAAKTYSYNTWQLDTLRSFPAPAGSKRTGSRRAAVLLSGRNTYVSSIHQPPSLLPWFIAMKVCCIFGVEFPDPAPAFWWLEVSSAAHVRGDPGSVERHRPGHQHTETQWGGDMISWSGAPWPTGRIPQFDIDTVIMNTQYFPS